MLNFVRNFVRPENENYRGPERRRLTLWVTRNTEYFLSERVCVAVRDRTSDQWLEGHLALGRALSGSVRLLSDGSAVPAPEFPQVGEALFFADGGPELVTSAVQRVERPGMDLAQALSS
jgi:hypothetical protein